MREQIEKIKEMDISFLTQEELNVLIEKGEQAQEKYKINKRRACETRLEEIKRKMMELLEESGGVHIVFEESTTGKDSACRIGEIVFSVDYDGDIRITY